MAIVLGTLLLALGQTPAFQSRPQSRPAKVQLAPVLEAGLRWLVAHREKDGHWRADAPVGSGRPAADTAATGLAVLALLGSGSSPATGPHQDVARAAVDWLLARQDRDGFIGARGATMAMTGHAIATLALSETAVLTSDATLAGAAQKAVEHLLRARAAGATWARDPRGGPEDRWALVWGVLTLRSARDARVPVDEQALTELNEWLERHTDANTGDLASQPKSADADPAHARAAAGLLCRLFLGQEPRAHPIMDQAARLIAERGPGPAPGAPLDAGFLYLGTSCLFQTGGEPWRSWSGQLAAAVAGSQRQDGDAAGSWDPASSGDAGIGRVGATALTVLAGTMYLRMCRITGGR